MFEAIPEVKIILTLPDSYERLYSASRYWKRREKLDRSTTLTDLVRSTSHPIVCPNCSGNLLDPWYEIFPDARIHVALFDRLQSDPDRYLSDVAEFLGVSDDWGDAETDSGANWAIQRSGPGVGRLARESGELLRRFGMRELPTEEVAEALRPVLNPKNQSASEISSVDLGRWAR